jgi:hypothetical protein
MTLEIRTSRRAEAERVSPRALGLTVVWAYEANSNGPRLSGKRYLCKDHRATVTVMRIELASAQSSENHDAGPSALKN